ncbi:MAG TPA: AI-2E family transporter, partial [Verrucomicrobiota bacterium]|nr:AI-2E family transporter [Verrucomicrobiota bacterium]
MTIPPPTEKQARLIWLAATGLAIATLVGLAVALIWGLGRVLNVLAPVLWPLAVAAVLAYLLDPVVDFFERHNISRPRAIGLVFFIALMLVTAVFSSVVPKLVVETQRLINEAPTFTRNFSARVQEWMEKPAFVTWLERFGLYRDQAETNAVPDLSTNGPAITNGLAEGTTADAPTNIVTADTEALETNITLLETDTALETGADASTRTNVPSAAGRSGRVSFEQIDKEIVQKATEWMGTALKATGTWFVNQLGRLTGLFGVVAGLALIPIYLFYLLLEKRFIARKWTDYLPVTDSKFKEELVFVLSSINDYLIAFFRGQVLVAICDGVLYGVGFALIGLPYAFLIGFVAIFLTIIPFLGAIVTCTTALLLAVIWFGDWQHPLGVAIVFAIVQGIEGYVLQPKILGDRVGLHPMIIIISVMTG